MKCAAVLLVAVAALIVSADSVFAQSAIDRLEEQLRGAAPAGQPAPANSAPVAQVEPGYLGLVADDRQENGAGLRILDVLPGGPADKAGLKQGDLIKSVDTNPVRSMDDFAKLVGPLPPGGKLAFQVERNGAVQPIDVTLGRRPPPGERRFEQFGAIPTDPAGVPVAMPRPAALGVRVGQVTNEVQAAQALAEGRGAVVVSIVEGSAAQKAGLPVNCVIVAIDGKPVTSPGDLARLVAEAGAFADIKLTYYHLGLVYERRVKLDLAGGASVAAQSGASIPAIVPTPEPTLVSPPIPEPVQKPVVVVDKTISESARVQLLEQKIGELERRLAEMEQQLKAAQGK